MTETGKSNRENAKLKAPPLALPPAANRARKVFRPLGLYLVLLSLRRSASDRAAELSVDRQVGFSAGGEQLLC